MNNTHKPATITPQTIDIATPDQTMLENGVWLYTLDCTQREVIRFSFVIRAGSSLQDAPFSASSVANLLSEGTTKYKASEIAEKLDFFGSYFDVSLDRDYAVINFVALSKFLPQTLEIAREILLHPTFPEHEIEIYKAKRKQRLAIERSKVAFKARELFTSTLFGTDHPYGHSFDQNLYDNLTRQDLVEFYQRRYSASNIFVVCSGRIKEHEKQMIASLAEDIPVGGDTTINEFPPIDRKQYTFGLQPGALQSAIRIGRLLFPRSHEDFIPMQVVSTILGGYFGSRLVHNLREERGYTYGIYSSTVNLEYEGYFAIGTEVATEVTDDAIAQIFAEMDRMKTELVPMQELDMVRNIMTGEVMRVLDGPFGIADVTIENIQNRSTNNYLDSFIEKLRAITPEEIRDTAIKYLDPKDFTTVIVGDKSADIGIIYQ